jgi:uncharacterized membrane protein YkoI
MRRIIAISGAAALCATGCFDQAKVPIETARQTALASVAGEVRSEELDREHGRLIYEFRIKPAGERSGKIVKEVEIDADTGEVIEVEIEPLK